jgi:hypothetical protein
MIKDAHSERSTERLRAFRRAAERAHDVVERFPDQSFSTRVGAVGRPDELTGLREDTFVRLTADVRPVFLPKQEACFDPVYNIVLARLQQDLHEHLAIVKENWKQSIGKGTIFQSLSAEEEINLSIRQGLESTDAWTSVPPRPEASGWRRTHSNAGLTQHSCFAERSMEPRAHNDPT